MTIEEHADEFVRFINESPTKFHAVQVLAERLTSHGFTRSHEHQDWSSDIRQGGRYFFTRNASSIVAFAIGAKYELPGPIAMVGTHLDAITWRVKPVSQQTEHGYKMLKIAPYGVGGGVVTETWLDRDLGIAGRVYVQEKGVIKQRLLRLPYPLAKIPSLAEHFGAASQPPFNKESQLTPIIGLTKEKDSDWQEDSSRPPLISNQNHSHDLIRAVANELQVSPGDIKDIELELYDFQPASRIGLDGELLSVPRCDDKLCTYSAMTGLMLLTDDFLQNSSQISLVASFDDEEVGSLLRQGAASNMLPLCIDRIIEALNPGYGPRNVFGAVMAQSFLISADVEHAVNPNFIDKYGLKPWLNTGPVLCCDANANVTTDSASAVIMQEIAERAGVPLQLSQIRNGEPSGGTIGPGLSSMLGVRACDLGLVQLGMHSIRGTTGSRDPGLGVTFYHAFFKHFASLAQT